MANYYIQQSINIHMLRVGGITNSSVLQIGSAGVIRPASYLYNTGGYTQPAPEAVHPEDIPATALVPLQPVVPRSDKVRKRS